MATENAGKVRSRKKTDASEMASKNGRSLPAVPVMRKKASDKPVQRAVVEEEPAQAKFAVQRVGKEEEEPAQGKFAVQRVGKEEEEPAQGKFAVQRVGKEEEEPAQAKFAVQRVGKEEEEPAQGKFAVQRVGKEEEEPAQGKFAVQRVGKEEEEPAQGKFAVQRVGKEEELARGKFAVQRVGKEEEEPAQGKFAVQRKEKVDEEDPLQGKFNTVQLKSLSEKSDTRSVPVRKKENNTGLPDNLKAGIEQMGGYDMGDVKVHYNSSKPARLQAHAYAQGTDIHIGPGQERHLPHEAWHVVQQKQGRVQATMQMKGGVPVNDDAGLEHEADVMGERALTLAVRTAVPTVQGKRKTGSGSLPTQLMEWPDKKKNQPKVGGTLWAGVDIDSIRELYEFCDTLVQFNRIIKAISKPDYDAASELLSSKKAEFLAGINSDDAAVISSYFTFFTTRSAVPKVLKVYDKSTRVFPSAKLRELYTAKGIADADLLRTGLRGPIGLVTIADEAYDKPVGEKELNSRDYSPEQRANKNAEIQAALIELTGKVDDLHAAKLVLDAEEAKAAAYRVSVAGVVAKAALVPSFAGVRGNALALATWNASVAFAGQTGYLQVDNTIYPRATITAATALLNTFARAYRARYPTSAKEYMTDPHTPGGGQPQDKTGHSNPELRTSMFQANFIATWGGNDTVIHMNSVSL